MTPLKVARVELGELEPPAAKASGSAAPTRGSAVVHAWLNDGREFSILAATPPWFREAFAACGLPYYFGPSVLFLEKIEKAAAKRAVEALLARGDRWLCLYDTPRTTLPRVLSDFKARHS